MLSILGVLYPYFWKHHLKNSKKVPHFFRSIGGRFLSRSCNLAALKRLALVSKMSFSQEGPIFAFRGASNIEIVHNQSLTLQIVQQSFSPTPLRLLYVSFGLDFEHHPKRGLKQWVSSTCFLCVMLIPEGEMHASQRLTSSRLQMLVKKLDVCKFFPDGYRIPPWVFPKIMVSPNHPLY